MWVCAVEPLIFQSALSVKEPGSRVGPLLKELLHHCLTEILVKNTHSVAHPCSSMFHWNVSTVQKCFPFTAGWTFFLLCVFMNVHIEFLHIVGLSTSRNPVIAPTFFFYNTYRIIKAKKKKDTCKHSHTQVVHVSFCNIWAFFVYFFVIFLFVLNWLSPHRSAQHLNILTWSLLHQKSSSRCLLRCI